MTAHLADHDEVRMVIGHKEFSPNGLYEQYKLRVEMIPLDDSNDVNEGDDDLGSAAYHPGRSLERSRFDSAFSVGIDYRSYGNVYSLR